MARLEFYVYEDELWCKSDDGRNFIVDETSTEAISYVLGIVRSRYPEAYKALCKLYEKSALNVPYYHYLMARRFCKCNFGCMDSTSYDITNTHLGGSFHFERVQCPLRGECACEGIVCCPKFDSTLSKAETRVMKLYYEGKTKEEIGEELFISPGTVKNHIKSAYLKLGVHSEAEFVKYVEINHLFNQSNQ